MKNLGYIGAVAEGNDQPTNALSNFGAKVTKLTSAAVLAAALSACGGGGGGGGGGTPDNGGGGGGTTTQTDAEFVAANLDAMSQSDFINKFGKLTKITQAERVDNNNNYGNQNSVAFGAADDVNGSKTFTIKSSTGMPEINTWFAREAGQNPTGAISYQKQNCDGGAGAGSNASTRIAAINTQLQADVVANPGNQAALEAQAEIDMMAVGSTDCVTNGSNDGRFYIEGYQHKTDQNSDGVIDGRDGYYYSVRRDINTIGTSSDDKLYRVGLNADGSANTAGCWGNNSLGGNSTDNSAVPGTNCLK
jgi:hypothetical protein